MASLTVIGCQTSLAAGIADSLGATSVKASIKVFPDGEGKITLDSEPRRGAAAVVVHSTAPPVDSNLVLLLSMIREARRFVDKVTAVVPYMGYARQDRKFLDGEVVTMGVVADLIEAAGASQIVVVDIHSEAALSYFSIPAINVSAVTELAAHFDKQHLSNPLVISPDMGGTDRARKFAELVSAECVVLEKERDRSTGDVSITGADLGTLTGRDIVLVDDMISTGGSVVKATEFLRGCGCKRVFAACTHPLLVDGAAEKMHAAGITKIVGTNTIDGGAHAGQSDVVVDVAGAVAGAVADRG